MTYVLLQGKPPYSSKAQDNERLLQKVDAGLSEKLVGE
jgi:hypothetical protein